MKSKLSGRNKILAVNTCAASVLRYGARILKWNKVDVTKLNRITRKMMTMYGALHPKIDVNRISLSTARGTRGLISCESCIRSVENNMGWYLRNISKPLQEAAKSAGIVDEVNRVKPEEFKKKLVEEGGKSWREKMFG